MQNGQINFAKEPNMAPKPQKWTTMLMYFVLLFVTFAFIITIVLALSVPLTKIYYGKHQVITVINAKAQSIMRYQNDKY